MDNLGSWLSRKWVATVASEAVQTECSIESVSKVTQFRMNRNLTSN